MKRINIVVSASEMAAVRKAILFAGANRLIIVPVSNRTCIGELGDWYCGTAIARREDHMRLEVTSDDNRSDSIISAILSTAHAAKIENISSDMPHHD
jgi:nitrogen regulatory protein PII